MVVRVVGCCKTNKIQLQVYVVARGARLTFYKDQKASKAVPESTFRGEPPLILEGASADVASDYTKKKHVLRIKYVHSRELITTINVLMFLLFHFPIVGYRMEPNFYCKHMMTLK